MLDLIEGRRIFADHLQGNFHKSKSLDSALMAAMEWAYRQGLKDGLDKRQNAKENEIAIGSP